MKCKRVHFVWICKEKDSFLWFSELLHQLEQDLSIDDTIVTDPKSGQCFRERIDSFIDSGFNHQSITVHDRHSQQHVPQHSKSTSASTLNSNDFLTIEIYITQHFTVDQVRYNRSSELKIYKMK